MDKIYDVKDNIFYQGKVTISVVMKNGKKIELVEYNHALPKLSEVFARAMCGYNVSANIPRYLMAQQISNGNVIKLLLHPVLLTGTNYSVDSTGFYYVSYNALITKNMIANVDASDGVYLVLLDSDNNELAEVQLVNSSGTTVTDLNGLVGDGKNLLINWKLKLTNTNDYDDPEA